MCWKCCLCICCCSSQNSVDDDPVDDDPVELTSRGAAKNQFRNWLKGNLAQTRFYIHCSSAPPKDVMATDSGLDPSFGKEAIHVDGESAPRKFILAFPARGNVKPGTFDIPKPVQSLWGTAEINFAYCFTAPVGYEFWAMPHPNPPTGQTAGAYQGDGPVETAFDKLIPSTMIKRVYKRDLQLGRNKFSPHPRTEWDA